MLGLGVSLSKGVAKALRYVKDSLKLFFNFKYNSPDFLLEGSTSFDGNDYIDLGDKSDWDMGSGDFTVGLYVKTSTNYSGAYGRILMYGEGGQFDDLSYTLFINTSNYLGFEIDDASTSKYATSSSAYNDGLWHHLVGVREGTNMKLYIDGSLITTTAIGSYGSLDMSGKKLLIGVNNASAPAGLGNYFTGDVANLGIWNRALSASEIESIRWRGAYSELKDTELTNLVSWYNLQGDVLDSAGSNNGTNNGATLNSNSYSGESPFKPRVRDLANPKMAVQLADGSTSFDGNDFINAGTLSDAFKNVADMSVSVWVYPTHSADAGDDYHSVINQWGSSVESWGLWLKAPNNSTDAHIWFDDGVGSAVETSSAVVIGSQWNHISVTKDATAIKMYLNGSEVFSGTGGSTTGNFSTNLTIGAQNTGSESTFYNGKMANISLHTSALTQLQVQELMFTEKYQNLSADLKTNLVSFYDMGSSSNPHNDLHGSNNGTNNGATVNTGYTSSPHGVVDPLNFGEVYSGRALNFDGSNDRVVISDDSSLDFGTGDFCVSLWFKTSDGGRLWQKHTNTASEIGMYMDATRFRLLAEISGSVKVHLQIDEDFRDGNWHHAVVVCDRDSTSNSKIYIDGLSRTLGTNTVDSGANNFNYGDLYLGDRNTSGDGEYEGKLNNIKFFKDVVLSESQVQELYTNPEQILPTGVSASNLKLDLPMQEGSGDYVYNAIPSSIDVTVNGDFSSDTIGSTSISGWSIDDFTAEIISDGYNGNGVKLTRSDSGTQQIYQDLSGIVSGYKYQVKARLRSLDGTTSAGVRTTTPADSNPVQDIISLPSDGSWAESLVNFTAQDTSARIAIQRQSGDSGSIVVEYVEILQVEIAKNHGTIDGATWQTGEKDGYQSALVRSNTPMIFDGADDSINVGVVSDYSSASGSISVWIYSHDNATPSFQGIVTNGSTNEDQHFIGISSNKVRYTTIDSSVTAHSIFSDSALSENQWVHVVATRSYDGANTTTKLYINGVLQADSGTFSGSQVANSNNILIGHLNVTRFFDGLINEVAIWDTSLDADAVTALYGSGTPLLPTSDSGNYDNSSALQGYWRNDGNTTWTDRSTNSNNGTASGSPVSIVIPEGKTGRDNQGFLLSNTHQNSLRLYEGEYVQVDDSAVLQNIFDGGGSVEAWIYAEDWGESDAGRIISKCGSGNSNGWQLLIASSGVLQFLVDWSTTDYNKTGGTISLSRWHHVAVTYDSTTAGVDAVLYIDGSSVTISGTGSAGSVVSDSGQKIRIGARGTGLDREFDGLVDEVRLYDKILSASEVLKNYNSGKSSHS